MAVIIPAQIPPQITGEVRMFAGNSVPYGWLPCDGSAVSRTTYARLFAAIGTAHGSGDGSTTFNLPDLQGRVPMGHGSGSGLTARTNGQKTGAETVALGTSEMPAHSHSGGTGNAGAHSHAFTTSISGYAPAAGGTGLQRDPDQFGLNASRNSQISAVGDHNHTIPSEGSGTPHANVQPSTVLRFIIAI